MLPVFGILQPQTGPETPGPEAPRKKALFGLPVDPAVVVPLAEDDALYLNGKRPDGHEPERPARKD